MGKVGEIERNKKIDLLMKAVEGLEGIKLVVFGNVAEDYKNEINNAMNSNVIMLGWQDTKHINDIFLSSDLAVFPGQHSVLWEQACACKLPCVFAYWNGMSHLDVGGNCKFIKDVNTSELRTSICSCINSSEYEKMKKVAESKRTDVFSYRNIALKSLETVKGKF